MIKTKIPKNKILNAVFDPYSLLNGKLSGIWSKKQRTDTLVCPHGFPPQGTV